MSEKNDGEGIDKKSKTEVDGGCVGCVGFFVCIYIMCVYTLASDVYFFLKEGYWKNHERYTLLDFFGSNPKWKGIDLILDDISVRGLCIKYFVVFTIILFVLFSHWCNKSGK